MGEETKIQWTDHTFNPWSGCTKVASGCANCYAEVNYSVKIRGVKWGPNGNRIRASDSMWKTPLAWDRQAKKNGRIDKVFCASLADVMEDWHGVILDSDHCVLTVSERERGRYCPLPKGGFDSLPEFMKQSFRDNEYRHATMDDLRFDLFAMAECTPNLIWQFLTKRPERVLRCVPDHWKGNWPSNVWMGTSVSDQETLNSAVVHMNDWRDIIQVRFLSIEPLLGPVDFTIPPRTRFDCQFNWVIIGGESGSRSRPCDVKWIRDIVRQCQWGEIPCFVKQLGENWTGNLFTKSPSLPGMLEAKIRDKKGGDISEWPADLAVREFPKLRTIAG